LEWALAHQIDVQELEIATWCRLAITNEKQNRDGSMQLRESSCRRGFNAALIHPSLNSK